MKQTPSNDQTFDEMLAKIGEAVTEKYKGRAVKLILAGKLWNMALDGDIGAAKLILDRLDRHEAKLKENEVNT